MPTTSALSVQLLFALGVALVAALAGSCVNERGPERARSPDPVAEPAVVVPSATAEPPVRDPQPEAGSTLGLVDASATRDDPCEGKWAYDPASGNSVYEDIGLPGEPTRRADASALSLADLENRIPDDRGFEFPSCKRLSPPPGKKIELRDF